MENKAPSHLSHKPIIVVDEYAAIDAQYAGQTDAKALSIGRAQWDNRNDLSAKVWRYGNDKWSRQSEELPIHRTLDLSILTIASILTDIDTDFPISNLSERVRNKEDMVFVKAYFKENRKNLVPRIKELHRLTKLFLVQEGDK